MKDSGTHPVPFKTTVSMNTSQDYHTEYFRTYKEKRLCPDFTGAPSGWLAGVGICRGKRGGSVPAEEDPHTAYEQEDPVWVATEQMDTG